LPVNIRSALKDAIARLRASSVPSHSLAAELLLMHALGRDRAWLYAHADEPIAPDALNRFFELIERRCAGTPTQYLTGRQEFWGLELHVRPGVLIPRPETEHIVEVALERTGHRALARIADVGTGSGCLAIALAIEFPSARVYASDISPEALAVARENADRHGVSARIEFLECNLLDALELPSRESNARLDLIVSNPPYVARAEAPRLPREIREHEPPEAVFAGETGAELYPALIEQAARLLAPGGLLVLELGSDSLPRVFPLLDEAPCWNDIRITHDLAGLPRVISALRR
jgi:release factor glutamine methyltransferase